MGLNAAWHKANPMPRNATMDQRIAWHLEHKRECACREIPASVQEEIKRRGLS
jgi:hypothetical protein